ncbi:hypothetical protein N7495_005960 [Penicillium taxi]|uniref:uncharacterized protein n=1 Tax=Penicillium taxi TaxID=168475 RepID=UPI002545B63E|nr:uncharacterized protein N7495_005960 [Penicillium taxi]KAJ5894269.1 hypothetical protein N7495_005960 [Penicillium taxi]
MAAPVTIAHFHGCDVLLTLKSGESIHGKIGTLVDGVLHLLDGRSIPVENMIDVTIPDSPIVSRPPLAAQPHLETGTFVDPAIVGISPSRLSTDHVHRSQYVPTSQYSPSPSGLVREGHTANGTFVDPAILRMSTHPAARTSIPPKVPAGKAQALRQGSSSLSNLFRDSRLNGTESQLPQDGYEALPSVSPSQSDSKPNKSNTRYDRSSTNNIKTKGLQTAFVESVPTDSARQLSKLSKGAKKKARRALTQEVNGWSTEDAADIHEQGDFDFQCNLTKFNKQQVFAQIRKEDTTADEARLVSHNRKPKAGTNDGKNLHWTENVLDSDTGDELVIVDKTTSTRVPSRKGSTAPIQPFLHKLSSSSRTVTPLSVVSPVSPDPGPIGSLVLGTSFCPTLSPLQTLEVEQIAIAEFGLTDDIISENAARGIAEATVSHLASECFPTPTILVIAGNHRTGARAIGAARHLRNRGYRVNVFLLGADRDGDLLESCRKQLDIFRKTGGRVFKWADLILRLSARDNPFNLVIDALFGMHVSFNDLSSEDQKMASEIISRVNQTTLNGGVLSIDIPSGISASTGEVGLFKGELLNINPKFVVCLGAPKTGILTAMAHNSVSFRALWKVSVADIGIPQIVWRKYGTRRHHGFDFGNRWVSTLLYEAARE